VAESDEEVATELLAHRVTEVESVPFGQARSVHFDEIGLHRFLRFVLAYDPVCSLSFAWWGEFYAVQSPPIVENYLAGLAFSEGLWTFAYLGW
jgi:hypothetical protein